MSTTQSNSDSIDCEAEGENGLSESQKKFEEDFEKLQDRVHERFDLETVIDSEHDRMKAVVRPIHGYDGGRMVFSSVNVAHFERNNFFFNQAFGDKSSGVGMKFNFLHEPDRNE